MRLAEATALLHCRRHLGHMLGRVMDRMFFHGFGLLWTKLGRQCVAPLVGKIIDTRGRGKISEGGVRHIPKT